jgi:histone H3/H4
MEGLSKPAITRLARKAGVKTMSDDCVDTIRNIIGIKMVEILDNATIINEERKTKTLTEDDIYNALKFLGVNVARSSNLKAVTCPR